MTAPRHRPPQLLTRRQALARLATLSAAAWATPLLLRRDPEAVARTRDLAAAPAGTTLERSIVTAGGSGPYFRLTDGPGWPLVTRDELADPGPGREGRREPLAALLHTTDFQFADVQSPARVEFLDRYADEPVPTPLSSAFRPQEAVVIHACEALLRRSHGLSAAPVTGRRLDATVCTGDNFDNAQANELDWFLTLMDGGTLRPDSGARGEVESVQAFTDPAGLDPHYYHPDPIDDPRGDHYRAHHGYPDYPGLLEAAVAPFDAVGAPTPWYSLWGNHDAMVQGNVPPSAALEAIAVGGLKVLHPPPGLAPGDVLRGLSAQDDTVLRSLQAGTARAVTPDADRRLISGRDFIRAHLASPGAPAGHGFTEDNLEDETLYYRFELAPGVVGLSLDTTSPGSAAGSIGDEQLRWLEAQLVSVHSRWFDGASEARADHEDALVVVFSHHRADDMQPIQGPDHAGRVEPRAGGDELEALLHRFPNVVAWVNGHSHVNRVRPRPDPQRRTGGFWDITTAAQVDAPQQARVLELVDNRDGTLSLFATVIDHAGPAATRTEPRTVEELAAVSRELAINDYQADFVGALGEPADLNVELLLPAPAWVRDAPSGPPRDPGRRVGDGGPPPPGERVGDLPSSGGDEPPVERTIAGGTPAPGAAAGAGEAAGTGELPRTGAGAMVGLGAIALQSAIALRERRGREPGPGRDADGYQ